jgi:hypothetical protein
MDNSAYILHQMFQFGTLWLHKHRYKSS